MLRLAWQSIRAAWKSLVTVGTAVGILYIWPDIRDLPAAYGLEWGQVFVPDQEIVAFALVALLSMWIVWMDIRPSVLLWWSEREEHPLCMLPLAQGFPPSEVLTAQGQQGVLYRKIFRIGIRNSSPDHRTIKRLQHTLEPSPLSIPLENNGGFATDIQPSAVIYFEIGYVYAKKGNSIPRGVKRLNTEKWNELQKIAQRVTFRIPSKDGDVGINLEYAQKTQEWEVPLWLVFTSDDTPPLVVKVTLKHDEENDVALHAEVVKSV